MFGAREGNRTLIDCLEGSDLTIRRHAHVFGAGTGNRTQVSCLQDRRSATELYRHERRTSRLAAKTISSIQLSKNCSLVVPLGIEPISLVLQTSALPTELRYLCPSAGATTSCVAWASLLGGKGESNPRLPVHSRTIYH